MTMALYIERVPNRNSPPAGLLRESFRPQGKIKKRTLANLSKWPDRSGAGLRILLKGGLALPSRGDACAILRSRPHGPVAAVLGSARRLRREPRSARKPSPKRDLVSARILALRSQLATARSRHCATRAHALGAGLGLEDAAARNLDQAMDWLRQR